MNLTAKPRRGTRSAIRAHAPTTTPGYVNPNRQHVVANTGAPSTTRDAQTIYHLHCGVCQHDYGCTGLDIKDRRCPACQAGARGEPLRERAPSLFD